MPRCERRIAPAVLIALQADEISAAIAERNIELVSVRELWDYSTCQLRQEASLGMDPASRKTARSMP
jgi:hypothetical protein